MQDFSRILIVDDDVEAGASLARALRIDLESAVFDIAATQSSAEKFLRDSPHVMILDLSLDPVSGVESGYRVLQLANAVSPFTRTIVLTGHGSVVHGVRALESGAATFLEKPADIKHLAALIRDAVSQSKMREQFAQMSRQEISHKLEELAGNSPGISIVREQLVFASKCSLPVLLIGETGTGKGVCARLIHSLSKRREKPFVRYQPNFGNGDLVASELFGHVKGSFTGATENQRGTIREADGGSLFLDEVDETPLYVQVLLLETLQEGTVKSIGGTKVDRCDFRLIAALNRPVDVVLSEGKLRSDFYHRIAHVPIELPPLRERLADIPVLTKSLCNRAEERHALPPMEFSDSAMDLIRSYAWPGNVRELQAVVERGCVRAWASGRCLIDSADLGLRSSEKAGSSSSDTLNVKVEKLKIELVKDALKSYGGNQVSAARQLGIDRKTLRKIARNASS